jgi:hypothetical protein
MMESWFFLTDVTPLLFFVKANFAINPIFQYPKAHYSNIPAFQYSNFMAPDLDRKNFSGCLISKEPTKIVVKISVNSRCNKSLSKIDGATTQKR